ncbi:MAG: PEP-CTERM sorting domain-containing protein [Burkholderiales bacterium]|jgi:hypothetical protein|nr:PEP-CTERM sorting domain-containing protein [Burkholderiales bacterium]
MKYLITTLATAAALALALPAQAVTVTGTAGDVSTMVGGSAVVTLTLDVSEELSPLSLTFSLDWPSTGLAFNLGSSAALNMSWAAFAATLDPAFTEVNQTSSHFGLSTFGTLPTLSAGTHTLQLSFTGLTAGSHAVSYELDLGDPAGGPDFAVTGSALVNVSAVPEPSPTLMLAAGLAAMGLIARRRRA